MLEELSKCNPPPGGSRLLNHVMGVRQPKNYPDAVDVRKCQPVIDMNAMGFSNLHEYDLYQMNWSYALPVGNQNFEQTIIEMTGATATHVTYPPGHNFLILAIDWLLELDNTAGNRSGPEVNKFLWHRFKVVAPDGSSYCNITNHGIQILGTVRWYNSGSCMNPEVGSERLSVLPEGYSLRGTTTHLGDPGYLLFWASCNISYRILGCAIPRGVPIPRGVILQ